MMKKWIVIWLTAAVIFVSGCAQEETPVQPTIPEADIKIEIETETEEETGSETGTAAETVNDLAEENEIDAYMASVEERASAIRDYLEQEAMTQDDMNVKSQELYEVWDEALNQLWGELKAQLQEDVFEELLDEQRAWIAEKESAVEAAGKEYEGGSVYPLVVNTKAAWITEARVYELYEKLY